MRWRPLFAVLSAFVLVSAAAGETLKIDFTPTGGPVEPGYSAYFATNVNPATFTAQNYAAFGGNVTIQPTWAASAVAAAMRMVNRTGSGTNAYTDVHQPLILDWIGTDNRQAGDPMTLTISGLPAGLYDWSSYHHDGDNQTGRFDVTVNDAAGSKTTLNFDITNSRGGDNILNFADISVFKARIVSNGSAVTLVFHCRVNTPTEQAFFAMNGFNLEKVDTSLASAPVPASGATDVIPTVILQWTPGDVTAGTNGHRVLLSDSFADVNNGVEAAVWGVVSSPAFNTAGLNLQFGTTYYWRVDQSSTPGGPWNKPGKVWSFTVEPYSLVLPGASITAEASSIASADETPGKTVDGSGLANDLHGTDLTTMWLSSGSGEQPTWIQYSFDNKYKLHQMRVWNHNSALEGTVGFGIKDAVIQYSADGSTWTTLGTTHQFARASGAPGYASNTTIDFAGAAARYVRITANNNWGGILQQYGLSEVRFYYIPARAREPQPANNATGVAMNADLGWRAGRGAVTHNVYFSTDAAAVANGTAPMTSVAVNSYDPGTMPLATTYFWRVDEVNNVNVPAVWEGPVWAFRTADWLVVDNMESYGDANTPGPPPPPGSRVWYTWKDGGGWGNPSPGYPGNGSGSLIGHVDAPFVETSIVHSGGASLPYYYINNSPGGPYYSEAIANTSDLAIGSDWTQGNAKSLTLWFRGDVNNVATATDQMYVKVNGVKVAYPGDMSVLKQTFWHEWSIDLAAFTGVNLANVTTITIGFGNSANTTTPGGSGIVFFDDIRLHPARCRADLAQPGADLNDDCVVDLDDIVVMAAQWLTDGHIVTPTSPGAAGLIGYWQFDGNVNDSAGAGVGSVTGTPVYETGVVDQAIKLNGANEFVLVESTWNPASYTMTMWFRSDGGGRQMDLLSMYGADGGHGILVEIQTNGTVRFLHRSPLGTGGGTNIYTAGSVVDGMWHHVVLTKSADTMAAYLDGELVGSMPDATVFDLPLVRLTMGVLKHDNLARYFYGALDDARLYNRALTAGEIAWLAGKTAPFSPRFDMNTDGAVDFKDFAGMTTGWLDQVLWP